MAAIAPVKATDIDLSATVVAAVAITLTPVTNLDFGAIDFTTGAHNGDVELGSDGSIALAGGAAGLVLSGTPSAGQFTIGSTANDVDISCDATAVVGDGTRNLTLSVIKYDTTAGTFAGTTNTCTGLGNVISTIDTGATPNPNIFVAANLNIPANALDGSLGGTPYDTATGGGDPVTFRVVFQ